MLLTQALRVLDQEITEELNLLVDGFLRKLHEFQVKLPSHLLVPSGAYAPEPARLA